MIRIPIRKLAFHTVPCGILGLHSVALGADLHVGAAQTYTSVQAAIDAASDGDVIRIHAGAYAEDLTINDKDLTLMAHDPAVVILRAGSSPTNSNLLWITQSDVVLEGLTLDGLDSRRLIRADDSNLTLVGVIAENAWMDDEEMGASVRVENGTLTATDCDFTDPITLASPVNGLVGGQLSVLNGSADLFNTVIANTGGPEFGQAWAGSAIGVTGGDLYLEGADIRDNTGLAVALEPNYNGGLWDGPVGAFDLSDSSFYGNASDLFVYHSDDMAITGTTFEGPGTALQGYGSGSVTDSVFIDTRVDFTSTAVLDWIRNQHCTTGYSPFTAAGPNWNIANNVFVSDLTAYYYVLFFNHAGGVVHHNAFLGEAAPASAFYTYKSAEFHSNLVVGHEMPGDAEIVLPGLSATRDLAISHNAFGQTIDWQTGGGRNAGGNLLLNESPLGPQILPDVVLSWEPGGGCEADLRLTVTSPLRDRGLLLDPDGSPSDIGPFGGPDAPPEAFIDGDQDGYAAYLDCNDADPNVHPFASEVCGGADEDCDGNDFQSALTWTPDADGDGFGTGTNGIGSCTAIPNYSTVSGDCDDTDPDVHPYALERCGGVDDDCSGGADAYPIDATVSYRDQDLDSYGDHQDAVESCTTTPGYIALAGDCDDSAGAIHPGGTETCDGTDEDCDEQIDEDAGTPHYFDGDSDGYGHSNSTPVGLRCEATPQYVANNTDCDDENAEVNPGAGELCDGIDNDCDGALDDSFDTYTMYRDDDDDGYGESNPVEICDELPVPDGWTTTPGDCWDTNPDAHPGATEICNNLIDEDCSPAWTECNWDTDGDGYCEDTSCEIPQILPGDCAPDNSSVHPHAKELCNGTDEDCDAIADDGLTWDDDNDQHTSTNSCEGDLLDCRDHNPNVYAGASEVCNGIDDNCDGEIDDGFEIDADGDGFPAVQLCGPGLSDCNDADPLIHPNVPEIEGNSIDDDCDDDVDEDPLHDDDDGDGCCDELPCADSFQCEDCDDEDAQISWAMEEVLDGLDNNCNGLVDEPTNLHDDDDDGVTVAAGDCDDGDPDHRPNLAETCDGKDNDCDQVIPWMERDIDHDGFLACDDTFPDCDDQESSAHPFLAEDCQDGIDNDCDGTIDQDDDNDQDGLTTCQGDCWDGSAAVRPGATEVCNGINDDCDEWTDEGFDIDGDGARDCSCPGETEATCDCDDTTALARPGLPEDCTDALDNNCDQVVNENVDEDNDAYTACGGDCNDHLTNIHPGAAEICDFKDNNCNGQIDEGMDVDGDGVSCFHDCNEQDTEINDGIDEICDEKDNDCDEEIDEIPIDQDGDGENICADCDDNDPTNQSAACDTDPGETAPPVETDDSEPIVETEDSAPIPPGWFCNSVGGDLTPWGLGLALLTLRRRKAQAKT